MPTRKAPSRRDDACVRAALRRAARLNPRITDWSGRRVWIIGASTGIGATTARLLAARGARLALTSRGEARLREVAPGALILAADVNDAAALEAAARRIVGELGGIDLVLLNAGTYAPMRAWEFDLALVRSTFETNLMGVMNGLAAVLPVLLAQGQGSLAIVSSVAGYGGLPKSLAYGPSKAALINLAESLYLDLAPRGIGVHLICPGFVETPLTAGNDFRMPALITADEAAREIVAGLEAGQFEIHFPKRFTRVVKFLRLLPYRLYFALIHRGTGL